METYQIFVLALILVADVELALVISRLQKK